MKRLSLGLGLLLLACVLGIKGSQSLSRQVHDKGQVKAVSNDLPSSELIPASASPSAVGEQKTVMVPAPPQPDPAVVNLQLCKKLIADAKQWSIQTNDNFFADLHRSLDTFSQSTGINSPEAQASKQFYIDHTKRLYAGYAAQAAGPYARFCGGSGSITDVLFEPSYDAL